MAREALAAREERGAEGCKLFVVYSQFLNCHHYYIVALKSYLETRLPTHLAAQRSDPEPRRTSNARDVGHRRRLVKRRSC
jgi:hypothetical protein